MPKRMSGLSEPYRSMASCQVMRSISPGRSPVTASVASATTSDTNAEHLLLADEARLHVELHELELAVGPQVLVAQAAGDLVVAVEAADHAQLLEQLRALRAARRTRPGLSRDGTTKSRAPSGVDAMSIGVSISTKP